LRGEVFGCCESIVIRECAQHDVEGHFRWLLRQLVVDPVTLFLAVKVATTSRHQQSHDKLNSAFDNEAELQPSSWTAAAYQYPSATLGISQLSKRPVTTIFHLRRA